MIHYLEILFLLLSAHYVCDFALQSDWMGKNKVPGSPFWIHVMTAHCLIHALGVFLITHCLLLALGEFLSHFAIDYAKSRNKISFNTDQMIHLSCKLLWAILGRSL